MNVLMVEPGKAPYETQIGDDLQSMQAFVGGYIQAVYPFEQPVALVCCESGKLDGLPLNRALRDADGDIYDIVAGNFFIQLWKVTVPFSCSDYLPYGYRLVNKQIQINDAEAAIVQKIFSEFLAGNSTEKIAEALCAYKIPCKNGKVQWDSSSIRYILRNEKYTGNSKWQKFYTPNEFPFRCKSNHGEASSYWAENTHPVIVSENEYRLAQELMERKSQKIAKRHDKPYPLRQKIYCGSCNSVFRRKEIGTTVYWVCLGHDRSSGCTIRQIPEETINAAFCRLYYKLKHHGGPIFSQMLSNLQKIRFSRMLWSEDVISLNKKISDILSQVQFLTQLQQAGGVDPDTFISSNNKLSEQLRRLKQEKARLLDTDSDDLADRTRDLMDALEDGPDFLDSFDAELFDALVDKIIVDSNERLRFRLKNGLELTEQIERTRR